MKKIYSIIASFLAIICVTSSCEGLLEEKLYNNYSSDSYFTNVDMTLMAVNSVYFTYTQRALCGQAYLAYDNDTDITFINGTAYNSGNEWRDISHYYITPTISWLEKTWMSLYEGINKANVILEKAVDVPTTNETEEKELKRMLAETKVLRAMFYFDLIRLYGDVPFRTTEAKLTDNFKVAATDRYEIYDYITNDMVSAIEDLPWYDEVGIDSRITKGAAMALLVRMYMFQGGYSLNSNGEMVRKDNYKEFYQKALDVSAQLIESGKHELNPSYEQIFKNHCNYILEPKESMFEADFYDIEGNVNGPGGYMGTWNAAVVAAGIMGKAGCYNRANAFVRTMNQHYLKYEDGDNRRDVNVVRYQIKNDGSVSTYKDNASQNWGLGKWRREYQTDDQWKDMNLTHINYVFIRYADVLLMRAEALNEINNGPTTEAVELVNKVRRRAFGKDISTVSDIDIPNTMSKNEFFTYLTEERARELCYESMIRRQDLIRWNLLSTKIAETSQFCKDNTSLVTLSFVASDNYTTGKHELYPKPARELRENPLLEQNPGYTK